MIMSNTQFGLKFGVAKEENVNPIDTVYTELIQLRHQNRALENRVKHLEAQNMSMT